MVVRGGECKVTKNILWPLANFGRVMVVVVVTTKYSLEEGGKEPDNARRTKEGCKEEPKRENERKKDRKWSKGWADERNGFAESIELECW